MTAVPEADPERLGRERTTGGPWEARPAGVRPPAEERFGTFRTGSVLSRALSVWGRNFLPFAVISLVAHLPLFAYLTYGGRLLVLREGDERPPLGEVLVSLNFAAMWMGALVALFVTGPLAFGVFEQLRGRRPSLLACIRAGLRAVPRALGVGFLLTLMLAGVLFVAFLALLLVAFLSGGGGPGAAVLFGYLLVLAIAFAIGAVMTRHALAVPAAVVERVGSGIALLRSRLLTRGNAWRIFGLWAIVFVCEVGAAFVTQAFTGGLDGPRPRFALLVDAIVSALIWTPLLSVALAVCYHDLRVSAEGVDPNDLARVFE